MGKLFTLRNVGLIAFLTAALLAPRAYAYQINATGSNPITFGTGATSSTITEKMRITSAGLIGIGTATPTTAFSVSGTISATTFVGDGSLLTGIAGSSSDDITSGTTNVTVNGTGYTSFTTGGVTTGYLDTSGRLIVPGISVTTLNGVSSTNGTFANGVVIGSTTLGGINTLRVVAGTGAGVGAYTAAIFDAANSSGSNNVQWRNLTTNYAASIGQSVPGTAIGNDLIFSTNPGVWNERMRITSAGLIGIGTATPTTALQISGTLTATAFVGDGSGLTGIAASGDRITSSTTAAVIANTAGGTVSFTLGSTAGAAYLHPTIGLVAPGVSTTGPISATIGIFSNPTSGNAALTVTTNGAANAPSSGGHSLASFYTADTTSDAFGGLRFGAYDDTSVSRHGALIMAGKEGSWTAAGNSFPGYLAFWTRQDSASGGNEVERMHITSTGNVGIGTSTPTDVLNVVSTVNGSRGILVTNLSSGTTAYTRSVFTNDAANVAGMLFNSSLNTAGYAGANGLSVGTFSTGPLALYTANAPRITITSAGLVGVGTTNPTTTLEVSGQIVVSGTTNNSVYVGGVTSSGEGGLRMHYLSPSAYIDMKGTGGINFRVDNSQGATTRMTVSASGVGIGTASPLSTLHISNSVTANGVIIEQSSSGPSATTPRIYFVDTLSGTVSTQPAWTIDNNRDSFRLFRQPTLTTGGTVAMTATSNTYIGMGTQTPNVRLDVAGAIVSRVVSAGAGTSFDWSSGNSQYTTATCGAFTMSNMQDGGTYSLLVSSTTTGTCSFTHTVPTTLTFKLPAGHGATTSGKTTLYGFTRFGTNVYTTWQPGY